MTGGRARLHPHPDRPPAPELAIEVDWRLEAARLTLDYRIAGAVDRIRLPTPAAAPARRDELWKHSCCELFVAGAGEGYAEFNFSPSGDWAAYAFEGYRTGMRPLEIAPPAVAFAHGAGLVRLTAVLDLPGPAGRVALTAVIEDEAGGLSYWSLAHPAGPPDFHHRDCFALKLPPAVAA